MRERYNHKLEKLNSLMAEMCNFCRFAIENSVNALFAENNDESKKYLALVHNIDRDIDNSEGEIEKPHYLRAAGCKRFANNHGCSQGCFRP